MQEARKHLLRNVTANMLVLAVTVAVGLWQIPFLIHRLGTAGYGQIGVLRTFVDYALLATFAITASVGRFLAIGLGRDDRDRVQVCFSTAFLALAGLGVAMLTITWMLRPLVCHFLKPLPGQEPQVAGLFMLMVLASCATSLCSPFSGVAIARHRFDLSNGLRIGGFAVQVTVLLLTFTWVGSSLTNVGLAYVLKESAVLAGAVCVVRRLTPWLRVRAGQFRWSVLREMGGMSLWIMVDRLGHLLYFSIDLVLIQYFLGKLACGQYAPLTRLTFMLVMFIMAVSSVFSPIVYEHIARGEIKTLSRHIQRTTKFLGLLGGFPAGLACGLAPVILRVWIGPEWEPLWPLLVLLIAPPIVNNSVMHLFGVSNGLNRVRIPSLVTVGGGVFNLLLSATLLQYTNLGLYGVALATGVAVTLRHIGFVPLYCAAITGQAKRTFYRNIGWGPVGGGIAFLLGWGARRFWDIGSFPELVAVGLAAGVVYALCAAVILGKDEVRFFASLLKRSEG